MRRRFDDKPRGTGRRQRKPVIFLSLEGNNKTEKLYLRALNKDHGQKYALNFTSGRETDLRNMWKALHELMQDSFSLDDGDKAYCLCDCDFEAYKLLRIREVKREFRQSFAKLVVSNPCFEIWFLNHFRYSTKPYASRRELLGDLCNYLPCYEKNTDYYFAHLKSKTADAVKNSVKQVEQISSGKLSEVFIPGNPGTEVTEIVQMLLDCGDRFNPVAQSSNNH